METEFSRWCVILVGLQDVNILDVVESSTGLVVEVETLFVVPDCRRCGVRAGLKDRDRVSFVDLAFAGRSTVLVWCKRRWRCVNEGCGVGSWTETNDDIAFERQKLTTRAGRWVTAQVGKYGRTVNEVAVELGAD